MALLLPQILLSITTSSRLQTNLGNEDFAYVSEETYKLQLAGQLSQPWVWIIDPLDGTRDFIDRTGNMRFTLPWLTKDAQCWQ